MRIGQRIRQLLTLLEDGGPTSITVLYQAMGIPRREVDMYCKRALEKGYVTMDRNVSPRIYAHVEGWRDNLPKNEQPKPALPPRQPYVRASANALWGAWQ